jgi:NADH dehydrogenase
MILVAGGSGFVGSAIVRKLRRDGADVAVMTAHPDRSRARIRAMGASVVEGSVTDAASLARAVQGAQVVVQALTFPSFPVEKGSRGWTFEAFDHRGTERLAQAAAAAGADLYLYSSGVGAAADSPKPWYRAKWFGERAIEDAGIAHTIVRPSWAYGPEDRALNRFVPFARWSPAMPVVGDGGQRLQPVFVDDVAEAFAQAARADGPRGVFEIGGPDVMSMNEVLRTLLEVVGKPKPLVHVPASLPKVAGALARYLPKPPLSPDAVDFLTADAVADTGPLLSSFDLTLTPLREGLRRYLSPPG